MRLRLRMQKSTPTSDKSLESAVSVEGRRLPVRRESKKTHECRARMFPLDRKVARRCNRFVAIAARAPLRVRANHRVDQTRLIRLDRLQDNPLPRNACKHPTEKPSETDPPIADFGLRNAEWVRVAGPSGR